MLDDFMVRAALAAVGLAVACAPLGCFVVWRRMAYFGDATAHAEIIAIREACAALGTWRLEGCGLYVTLEPCPMCAGAVINARIPLVVYGAPDPATGSCGGVLNLFEEKYGHRPAIYGGVLKDECAALLSDFFRGVR